MTLLQFAKQRALFIGGFSVGQDGTEGGQVYACRSLVASPLSEYVDWKIVDSTQRSLPPPGMHIRAFDAAWRMIRCFLHLVFSRLQIALVFTNFSWLSILEKGIVCLFASTTGKHTVISFRSFPLLPRRGQRAYICFVGLVCRRCDRIICQSQGAADEIVRLFGTDRSKLLVIHNWIDTTRYDLDRDVVIRSGDEPVRIIYVGWMRDVKGVQFLIPAIAELAKTHRNFHLTLCGGGALLHEMKAEASRLSIDNLVTFRGWVENAEVQPLMENSDILVLPSLAEGMPNAIIQAMACGLPVLSTRVTSIPEIIENGVNGILVEPASAQAICDGLRKLIDSPDLRAKMSHRNRRTVQERHEISAAWKKVASVLGVNLEQEPRTSASTVAG